VSFAGTTPAGPPPRPGRRRRRRGLVCGAGGVLGFAWTVGALSALLDADGFDAASTDVLVGTSAGAVMAAFLGAGVELDTIVNHQFGLPVEGQAAIDYDPDIDGGGPPPPRPEMRMGSRRLFLRVARHPRRYPPVAALSSLLPRGRGSMAPIGRMVEGFVPAGEWASHPATWIVAMDFDTGKRVPFGRVGSPPAGLSEAVMASCAIPGWYAPVRIGRRRYVDGGTCSATSADLLANLGLDEVIVLAPTASFSYDMPSTVAARVERTIRRASTRRLMHEVAKVRRSGTEVTILTPGRKDLLAIGSNLMDPRRRELVLQTSLRTSAAALAERPGWVAAG
jgi:NTE family protein